MNDAQDSWWRHTLIHHLWELSRHHWRFQVTLPRLRELELHGVKLDVTRLSRVMKNLLLSRRYEESECRLAGTYLNASDRVLELGGAIGFVALFCQLRLGVRFHAVVEANPQTVELLRRNFALNGVAPRVINAALAPAEGPVALKIGYEFWEDTLLKEEPNAKTVLVPGLTFTQLLAKLDFEPNVLIIDIEGAEKFIDPSQIPPSVGKVLLELHRWILGVEATYAVLHGFMQAGFRVHDEASGVVFLSR